MRLVVHWNTRPHQKNMSNMMCITCQGPTKRNPWNHSWNMIKVYNCVYICMSMCECVWVYLWAEECNKGLWKITGIQYNSEINENVCMIPPILPDSCIDNDILYCTMVFKRCTFYVFDVLPSFFKMGFNFECIKFHTSKFKSHTHMYTHTHKHPHKHKHVWI